ncbi:MAG TPA: low molecular weight phosphotyrosine protein phosphatase [Gammaproteobacteria bacterium]|nr:low molecular weight phosphotyrosine protein phosphatase [Gammaproteobacteria bacterium]
MSDISVLFVCMGNICRSPTAQGVFESVVEEADLGRRIRIDSAGTHAYHVGEPPDRRAMQAAAGRGIDLGGQRARRVEKSDFEHFDYVLAMDSSNLDDLLSVCPQPYRDRVSLFLEFADNPVRLDVPDPYYGGGKGFEEVLDLVEAGARGLLETIRQQLK